MGSTKTNAVKNSLPKICSNYFILKYLILGSTLPHERYSSTKEQTSWYSLSMINKFP